MTILKYILRMKIRLFGLSRRDIRKAIHDSYEAKNRATERWFASL